MQNNYLSLLIEDHIHDVFSSTDFFLLTGECSWFNRVFMWRCNFWATPQGRATSWNKQAASMHRCLTWTLIPWLVRHTKLAKKVCPAYRSSWTTKEVGPNLEITSFPLHWAHGRGQCRQVEPVQASGGYQGDRGLEKCGRETSAIKEKWDCWGMEGGRCPKTTGWVLGVYEDQRNQCSCFCSKYVIAPDGGQSFSEEAEILFVM